MSEKETDKDMHPLQGPKGKQGCIGDYVNNMPKFSIEAVDENKEDLISPKGLAVVAAIESGLLPQVDGGWNDSIFKAFWDKFKTALNEQGYLILKVSKHRNN